MMICHDLYVYILYLAVVVNQLSLLAPFYSVLGVCFCLNDCGSFNCILLHNFL